MSAYVLIMAINTSTTLASDVMENERITKLEDLSERF